MPRIPWWRTSTMMQTTLRRSTIGALRGRIRERWPSLSEDEIDQTGGSLDRLIDLIHGRTGETRSAIKRELRRILAA
jgi:hypothetical protein